MQEGGGSAMRLGIKNAGLWKALFNCSRIPAGRPDLSLCSGLWFIRELDLLITAQANVTSFVCLHQCVNWAGHSLLSGVLASMPLFPCMK